MGAVKHGFAERVLMSSAVFTGKEEDASPGFIALQGTDCRGRRSGRGRSLDRTEDDCPSSEGCVDYAWCA